MFLSAGGTPRFPQRIVSAGAAVEIAAAKGFLMPSCRRITAATTPAAGISWLQNSNIGILLCDMGLVKANSWAQYTRFCRCLSVANITRAKVGYKQLIINDCLYITWEIRLFKSDRNPFVYRVCVIKFTHSKREGGLFGFIHQVDEIGAFLNVFPAATKKLQSIRIVIDFGDQQISPT